MENTRLVCDAKWLRCKKVRPVRAAFGFPSLVSLPAPATGVLREDSGGIVRARGNPSVWRSLGRLHMLLIHAQAPLLITEVK